MNILRYLRYKLTHISKFPKGNVVATMHNLAQRGFEPKHIVDIGANKGRWSTDAQAIFPNSAFTMIEPQSEMKPHLDRFCKKQKNAQWIQAGAGSHNGSMTFTVTPDTVSSSFVFSSEEAKASGYPQREIPVYSLNYIVKQYVKTIPDIVKIDAEGFEHEILLGASDVLGKTELIFLEAQMIGDDDDPCSFIQLTNTMSDFGYAPYDFTWFGKRPSDEGAIGLCEVAYVRKDGILRNTRSYHDSISKAA